MTYRYKWKGWKQANNKVYVSILLRCDCYNYINDDDALVIGYYDIASKKQSDVICENGFYISSGLPAVIDNSVILPITLNTNEHKLMMINTDSNTSEMIFNEFNSYPIDSLAQVIGKASIDDSFYIKDNARKIIETREYTKTKLKELGFVVPDSYANFVFVNIQRLMGKNYF